MPSPSRGPPNPLYDTPASLAKELEEERQEATVMHAMRQVTDRIDQGKTITPEQQKRYEHIPKVRDYALVTGPDGVLR
jgi:hypothetical protein